MRKWTLLCKFCISASVSASGFKSSKSSPLSHDNPVLALFSCYLLLTPCSCLPVSYRRPCRTNEANRLFREAQNLDELYRLGHFLKGSSATLGLTKVKDSCEKIQRYGKKENLDGSPEKDEALCLSRVTDTLKTVKAEYADVEKTLKDFFNST